MMNFRAGYIAAAALWAGSISVASAATTIGFENFSFEPGDIYAAHILSPDYAGLVWTAEDTPSGPGGWLVSPNYATFYTGGLAKEPYAHSGENFAWNSRGANVAILAKSGQVFDLHSFWVRGWFKENLSITAHGYLAGVEVYTFGFTVRDDYIKISPELSGIDSFRLTQTNLRNFSIDDLEVSAVPEPSTWVAFLIGLGLIVPLARVQARA